MYRTCVHVSTYLFLLYLAPGNPNNITVTSFNATAVTLIWTEPVISNGIIRYYLISILTRDNSTVFTINQTDVTDLTTTIIGLRHNTNYRVNVRAVTVRVGEPGSVLFTTRPCKHTVKVLCQKDIFLLCIRTIY